MTISPKKKLVTHNGSFHADDVFAAAVLSLLLEKRGENFDIVRTRDEEIIKTGDYVFDIGGIYTAGQNRFDHHQIGGAGKRENGIEYASFGLVWKKFGEELCGDDEVVNRIDEKLVQSIDAGDNGIDLYVLTGEIKPYSVQNFFYAFRPSWNEGTDYDTPFLEMVEIAKKILSREIVKEKNILLGERKFTEIYNSTKDKRLIILDDRYPFTHISLLYPEILFVVVLRPDGNWGVEAVRKNIGSFENRKNLPFAWAGLRDKELTKVSGVSDAVFCHRALFLAVAKTKEGAIKLAQIALVS